jgi:putative membrane protein
MQLIVKILISAVSVFIAAYILPGVTVTDFYAAIIVAIVLGAVNMVIRPILLLLTLPITLITFGLFAIVINAALVLLVDYLIPTFSVESFVWAILFSIVVSIISWFLQRLR